MGVNEEDVVNIMGGMEHAGGIKLNDHKRKLKNRSDWHSDWVFILLQYLQPNPFFGNKSGDDFQMKFSVFYLSFT